MSRTALPEAKKSLTPNPKKDKAAEPEKPKETMRDFVEQIVVAVILAILIRAFDAEAFVIPTGSMAPTLMGRHKEIQCPQCGYLYSVNASDDTEQFIQVHKLHETGICVNCRFRTVVDETPSFKGDRILVEKFPYELNGLPGSGGPNRWDVVVFHFPGKPETNYIKRLVGMPGEDLWVFRGDVQTRASGTNDPFQIQRKPMIHQRAMQMLVHDNSYRPTVLEGRGDWQRWQPGPLWKEEVPGTYAVEAPIDSKTWSELRYRHVVPDPEQWAVLEMQRKVFNEASPTSKEVTADPKLAAETWNKVEAMLPLPRQARPTLITDFYSYNTNASPSNDDGWWIPEHDGWLQHNWVGDLTVACKVDVASAEGGGKLKFELIEAGVSNRCEIDLISGRASLYHGEVKLGEGGTVLHGVGSHDVEFANVDDRLTLLIDGRGIFDDGLTYEDGPTASHVPNARDLDPVGVAIMGAKAKVSGLVLKRDIYYTEDPSYPDHKIEGVLDGYSSRLSVQVMAPLSDVSQIPREGMGQLIFALVNQVPHFRIFDGYGKMRVDTDATRLIYKSDSINALMKLNARAKLDELEKKLAQLEKTRSADPLVEEEKDKLKLGIDTVHDQVRTQVLSIVEFTRIIRMFDFLADPTQFDALKDISSHDPYVIRSDHFMMLGDNSPRSSDSRAWDSRDNQWRTEYRSSWEVPRSMIIGKAFFVYWPHGKPFGTTRGTRDFRFPFRPYFERMKWIR